MTKSSADTRHQPMQPLAHFESVPDKPEDFINATWYLNWEDAGVTSFVQSACDQACATTTLEKSIALFYAVRDQIRYDPYQIVMTAPAYRASQVISDGHGWCVTKAGLLAACLRSVGVPSVIGLADVKNHLTSEKLRARMGTDVFYDHGYVAAWINDKWFKLVPAFNIELCERFDVRPTDFDGTADALYQQFDSRDRLHMQYLADHGTWSDLPLEKVRADFRQHYPAIYKAAAAAKIEQSDPFA